jgi:hypothetical protein
MKQQIITSISKSTNLNQIVEAFNKLCRDLRKDHEQIGYVAGMVFSEGPENVKKNIDLLEKYTIGLRKKNDFPIFSSVDLFYGNEFYNQIEDTRLPYKERRVAFIAFYRKILQNTFLTDIFMTPRWQKSEGATDEHETAKKQKLTIHYVEGFAY